MVTRTSFSPLPIPLAGLDTSVRFALMDFHYRALEHHDQMCERCHGPALVYHEARREFSHRHLEMLESRISEIDQLRSN